MKIVNAYIKTHKLPEVVEALHRIDGLSGITVLHGQGFGRSRPPSDGERADELGLLQPHEKIEVLCRDTLAEEIVTVIETTAHTGLRGDGKIYVCTAEETVRIATGERDEDAD